LLVPAVQKVREAANRATCQNNLKQIGLAMHGYHDVKKFLPPSRIADQYPSWAVLILPHLEQDNLYRLWDTNRRYYDQTTNAARQGQVPVYLCPARRSPPQLSISGDDRGNTGRPEDNVPGTLGDYAVCDGYTGDETGAPYRNSNSTGAITVAVGVTSSGGVITNWRSNTRFQMIKDGLSNTLLVGEKHVPRVLLGIAAKPRTPAGVEDKNHGDGSIFNGDWPENVMRAAGPGYALTTDPNEFYGLAGTRNFGSWHTGIVNFVMCDGSVQSFSTGTSTSILALLAQRADRQPIPSFGN